MMEISQQWNQEDSEYIRKKLEQIGLGQMIETKVGQGYIAKEEEPAT